ncbi:MAG: molybdopterin-binding protein [Acidimicrobiia bacterium]|nr:molybdopterin-binding protein [Acidimicrobiia bacterium]
MATVRLPSSLDKYAGGRRSIEVTAATVDAALRQAVEAHPDLRIRLFDDSGELHPHLMVFCREAEVPRRDLAATALEEGDRVDLLIAIAGGADDVRMRGFRQRASVEQAISAALDGVDPLDAEAVEVTECAGRVLAGDVRSEVNVPGFRRATMDGFSVRAADTFGASAYNPVILNLVGSSMPGVSTTGSIEGGAAGRIMTGAPVPDGADAVLRAEDALETGGRVEVRAPVAPAKNVGRVGEDIETGTTVLRRGRRLLPQDAGLLASIGHHPVLVHRRPVVRVIVSGDELLAPGERPEGSKIVDSNSPMLAALVIRDGGSPEIVRLPDDEQAMRDALSRPGADVIVTAGAASVGTEDRVPVIVDELGELVVHGVAMRPSSPTGVGRIAGVPVLLLPGNPVSCLVAYDFFAGPVIRRMGGLPEQWPYLSVRLPLEQRLVSQIGRTDYARVQIENGRVRPLAISGASVLSSVTRASGFVVVPSGLEGYAEGTGVEVHLYDPALVR